MSWPKGKPHSEKTKQKLREIKTGFRHSEKTKNQMSTSHHEYWEDEQRSGKHRVEMREVGKRPKSKEAIQRWRESRKGWHQSEEAKQKLRDRVVSEETRQKIREANTGKVASLETKQKMSEAQRGPAHHAWKEDRFLVDIRDTPEYRAWRSTVFERDNYICQGFGPNHVDYLEAHHKKSVSEYPELIFDVDNGITLCLLCHTKEHPKNGLITTRLRRMA